jgi:glycosyltransferase involved in cell wall biosynthesis
MLTKSDVLIVVPAFNEAGSIGAVLGALNAAEFHVLVVNDGSTDETEIIARRHGAEVLSLPYNMGVGGALRAGFQVAVESGYEAIVQIDADGQHPTELIDELIGAANTNQAHMVIGSRFLTEQIGMDLSLTRRIVMRYLASSASRAASTRITDSSSGFRLIRRPLLNAFSRSFSANYLGDTFEAVVMAGRGGFKICEIPAPLRERQVGKSSASILQSVQFTLKGVGVALLRLHPRISANTGD